MSKIARLDPDVTAGLAAILLLVFAQFLGALTIETKGVLLTFAVGAFGRFAVRRRRASLDEARAIDEVEARAKEAALERASEAEKDGPAAISETLKYGEKPSEE